MARIGAVRRDFQNALVLGAPDVATALRSLGIGTTLCSAGAIEADVQCDEDRLPFSDRSFDLVVSTGVLDSVNDLPGALILIRRALRPGGLFLGAMIGAGSLPTLRRCLPGSAPRFHPQIDVRAAGDLLGRAGFALPVADRETFVARYSGIGRLIRDLRANNCSNRLLNAHPLARSAWRDAKTCFADREEEGKTAESYSVIYLTGWAPEMDSRASGTIGGAAGGRLRQPRL